MSNQVDHRQTPNDRNRRRKERRGAHSCGGEGHNGAIGRTRWKVLSRRSERRAAGTRIPKVGKRYAKRRPILTDSGVGNEVDPRQTGEEQG